MRTIGIGLLGILASAACAQDEGLELGNYADDSGATAATRATVEPIDVAVVLEPTATQFFANARVDVRSVDAIHLLALAVDVRDVAGQPAAGVEIYGTFSGSLDQAVVLSTNADGIAYFKSSEIQGHVSIGFEIDGVGYYRDGRLVVGEVISEVLTPIPCFHGQQPAEQQ